LIWCGGALRTRKDVIKHRAALAGAALVVGAFALIAGRGSGATVDILTLVDAGCCSVSDVLRLQNDSARDLLTVNEVGNDGTEKAGDSLGPDAAALTAARELDVVAPDAVSAVAASETSVLTRLLIAFADLRTRLSISGH
jgi:hypothetical protein